MIHPQNNPFDLPSIEIATKEPFAIGDTRIGKASGENWICHWADESTLAIAPEREPNMWRPAHVYSHSNGDDMHSFVLEPSERESARSDALEKAAKLDLDELKEADDALEEELSASNSNPFDGLNGLNGLSAKFNQARELIEEARTEAAVLLATISPPSTSEPWKLPSRSRR
jgi:hypothetical protein